MSNVLDDWLDELLDSTDTCPAEKNVIPANNATRPGVVSQITPEPAPIAVSQPINHAAKVTGPSTWATLQAQAQQTAPVVTAREASTRWLRLRCGQQTYAVELLKVQEVVLPLPLLALRGSEPAMLGIMNLRGQVVPVIDLSLYLGGKPTQICNHTRIVVLEENGQILGLRTDAVDDVAHLTASDIEAPQHIGLCRNAHTLFCGMARIDEQPTILLDAGQLLHAQT